MKKILFIMQLPPPIHGASQMNQYIKNSRFINQNFECDYVDLKTSKDMSRKGKNDLRKYFTVIGILYKVFRNEINKKYDLCYITLSPYGIGFLKDSLIVLLLKLIRKKIIFHLHGKGVKKYYENSGYILKKYQEFIYKNVYLVHLSSLLINDVPEYKGIKKRFIVPNGVEVYDHKQDIQEKNVDDHFEILLLSSLTEEKGVLVALYAISIVSRKYKHVILNIVGNFRDKSFEKDCFNYVKENNLEKYVKFKGPKYNEDKYKEYENNDIFIFPTFYKNETFGLVNLEAMQFGLPIISTYEGAIPEIVIDGQVGFLMQKKNSRDLAKKIEILLNDDGLRKRMGSEGKKKFFEQYTIECFEKNLNDVFNNILKEYENEATYPEF